MAHGHHRDQGQGWEGVPLPADRLLRRQDRRVHGRPGPNAELANRMLVKAVETLPEGARPLVHSDRGCHCRRPGWLALMDRYGPARSTGAKGRSPDDATAEGFLGRMRTEPVYPRHWGGAYPRRGARPDRRLHPLARPRAHQTVDWLDESCTNTVKAREWLRDHLQENVRSPLITLVTHSCR